MTSHRLSAPPQGPHAAEDLGHYKNVAMWTSCWIAFAAACVGTLAALGLGNILWVVCAVLVVVALVAFAVMNRMGMGQYTNKELDSAEGSPTVGIG